LFSFPCPSQVENWQAADRRSLMSQPQSTFDSPFARCAECGAQRHAEGRFCWLCGGVLPGLHLPASEEIIIAEVVGSRLSAGQQRLLIWLAVFLVAVVGFGVAAAQDWIIAILFAVAVVPTLLVILFGTTLARAQGTPWTPRRTAVVAATTVAGTVLTTVIMVVVAFAVVVLLLFAMFIALFHQCVQALSGGGA
jgi:hypothetical protein